MRRVLVVDDEAEIVETVCFTLSTLDVEVVTANDGKHALDLLMESTFNLIISDIMMPKLGGLSLLQKLRSRGLDTPVIFISGVGEPDLKEKARAGGAHAFLDKPFSSSALVELVRGIFPEPKKR